MTAQRDTTFDIMKGIGILLVLLGHVYEWKAIGHFVYSFHMPLFFIVAGYFSKRSIWTRSPTGVPPSAAMPAGCCRRSYSWRR